MTRSANFKAWDKKNKKWSTESLFLDDKGALYRMKASGKIAYMDDVSDDYEVVWGTGIFDKNNVEIFEGDVLYVTVMLTEMVPPYFAVVEWDKYRFSMNTIGKPNFQVGPFPMNNLDPFGLELEIVGNTREGYEIAC